MGSFRYATGLTAFLILLVTIERARAADVSGPQPGDALTSFTVRGVLDDEAGKNIDLVKDASGKPLIIFFLQERTRPSIALARQVLNDAAARKADGLDAGLVFVTPDIAGTEDWIRMVTQVLPRGVPIGVSPDGPEGPAAYSLSRKVQATVIVGNKNRVVANFALQAPNPADDAAKIAAAISAALRER